jgi:hypothetical protein
MLSSLHECDLDRLCLSLEDLLSQPEWPDPVQWCLLCRREQEQMAAASCYWSDTGLRCGEPTCGARPTDRIVPELVGKIERNGRCHRRDASERVHVTLTRSHDLRAVDGVGMILSGGARGDLYLSGQFLGGPTNRRLGWSLTR